MWTRVDLSASFNGKIPDSREAALDGIANNAEARESYFADLRHHLSQKKGLIYNMLMEACGTFDLVWFNIQSCLQVQKRGSDTKLKRPRAVFFVDFGYDIMFKNIAKTDVFYMYKKPEKIVFLA